MDVTITWMQEASSLHYVFHFTVVFPFTRLIVRCLLSPRASMCSLPIPTVRSVSLFFFFFIPNWILRSKRRESVESAFHERGLAGQKLSRFSDQRQECPCMKFATKRYTHTHTHTHTRCKHHSFPFPRDGNGLRACINTIDRGIPLDRRQ